MGCGCGKSKTVTRNNVNRSTQIKSTSYTNSANKNMVRRIIRRPRR